MLTKLYPSEYCRSIFDIDLKALKKAGFRGLAVDLDNTIIARGSHTPPEELKKWLIEAKSLGFKVCILSNNWLTRVSRIAAQLDLPLVARAAKPRRRAFVQAVEEMGTTITTTVVVGDQIFTDVLGGNLAGTYTILVVPISDREAPHTRVLRRLERVVMRNYHRSKRARK
ncbi:MAG: YqeG family HAD IIIA-type phosphatase [Actinobacteria bacterium]|nr:YqeG family HAD IIIA-type phosphatase [Actinomycetota bacterium]